MAKMKLLTLVLILLIIGFFYLSYTDPPSRQFASLLKNSEQSVLDLRKLDAVDWDELVFLEPYADICNYNISQYEKNGPNCWSSNDDSECYLLLLLKNRLVSKIKTDRKKIDLTKAQFQNRLSKEKAIFQFTSQGEWPSVKLVGER